VLIFFQFDCIGDHESVSLFRFLPKGLSMESIYPVLSLLCGIAVAAIFMWVVLRLRNRNIADQAENAARDEVATLQTQFASQDLRIQALQADKENLQQTVNNLQEKLQSAERREGELSIAVKAEQRRNTEQLKLLEDAQKNCWIHSRRFLLMHL
jgi:flagellar biosynthesis/type III secretory pathway M-ring protein FliF/YscJ